ncbi:hemolysin III family protein [Flavobacteriaceae bacterium AU392]|nr:hemolysin III family protein [Flavobacteriaceae bacterium]RKM85805.1 hemolysin III family protein [Flavobacteriaceae bacterium AU392]
MRTQTKREESLNVLTHGLGAILSVIGFILLINANTYKTSWSTFSIVVYGLSMIILFTASTLYHYVEGERKKHYFKVVDHISIYLLIAGTYTPVTLIILEQSLGWTLFYIVWGIAAFGTILKLFFTGRFNVFSTLLYLVMGWLIVFDYTNVADALGTKGVYLLFGAGIFYTIGIVFYAIEKIPYNHVIWHLFVLGGAICHFLMMLWYVI